MFIDLTLEITKEMWTAATTNLSHSFNGHIGTHFDVENQTFPLEYCRRKGWIFDVRSVPMDREIGVDDIDLSKVESGMFVGFFSGYIETEPYGSKKYFAEHPALSVDLIEKLIEKEVSLVGLDFSGMRLGAEHNPMDRHCAEHGMFAVENMANLGAAAERPLTVYVFPMRFAGMTGLPCRVLAESLTTSFE